MNERSILPDFAALEVPWDSWSEPFWQAGAEGRMLMPRCLACGTFRWPAGPFCPTCHTQPVEWVSPGQGRIHSFTILPVPSTSQGTPLGKRVPVLIDFDDAPGVRLLSVLAGALLESIVIGCAVEPEWVPAANAAVPIFILSGSD